MTSTINKKTSKNNKENEDMLSSLPEDVLSHILFLMPTKFSVQTSILSKRWRYTWMSVYTIDFDDIRPIHNQNGLSKFVDPVLALFNSKVEVFRLNFSKCIIPKPTMFKWINEAVRLNVYECDLHVKQIDIPLSLFTCKTLTKFRLDCQRYKHEWNCPSLVSLPSLKSLDIAVDSKPLDNAFKLIHGYPVLENLSLVILHRYSAENYSFVIPTLKRLKLSIHTSLEDISEVVLYVSNLEYLCVKEECLKSLFVIKDLSSLVEAKASFKGQSDHLWVELLKGIREAQYLTLNIGYWHEFNYALTSPFPVFPNVKHLELTGFRNHSWLLIHKILENCTGTSMH